jgi:glucose-6-phosphate dehydrogenase assembly protein OpcA
MAPAVSENGRIELADVEHALATLRDPGYATVRATTLNLVIWCPDGDCLERAGGVLEGIGGSRPLRAIMLIPGSGRPMATVSSNCWDTGGREICSEQVTIEGAEVALPSAVAYLLVPDLPVFAWWQGTIPDDGSAVFGPLAAMANRLIVDSDIAGIEAIERISLQSEGIVDLAWARTAAWREAMAGLFDAPHRRRALGRLIGVEVVGPRNEAKLLAGWLRSRLDRQIGLDGRPAKRLRRIELVCGDETFYVEREARAGYGVAGGPDAPDHPVSLPLRDTAAVLAAELDRLGGDEVFEQALLSATG